MPLWDYSQNITFLSQINCWDNTATDYGISGYLYNYDIIIIEAEIINLFL